MRKEPNESQKKIIEQTDGLVVVDAGPGTGKTATLVDRYIKIVKKADVSPKDVLMMTFTNNAAHEMEERIKSAMAEAGMLEDSKQVVTKTFDAFCLSVVMESPELVSDFFKVEQTLTRSATLSDNESINKEDFRRFLDDFLEEHGGEYGDYAVIASQSGISLFNLFNKLMARGTIPMKNGWFGAHPLDDLRGDTDGIEEAMNDMNVPGSRGGKSAIASKIDWDRSECFDRPEIIEGHLDPGYLADAANEDRRALFDFVHDVFYAYIVHSIRNNKLTFGLVATFAFVLLYSYPAVRDRNSFRYIMIDEFQDTNANQLMISMMLLDEPNLCVVGDWKQGIYGFRFVSIDNIINFPDRLRELRAFLNEDTVRVKFHIEDVTRLSLDTNYRSSQEIIDTAFRCMTLKATKTEKIDVEGIQRNVVNLKMNDKDPILDTDIRYVQVASKNDEAEAVVQTIWDYVTPGRYTVRDGKGTRAVAFNDIAVICRKTEACRAVMEACDAAGIPAYLQGDVRIMSTREGKLTLAWLRFVNNERDRRGYVPILADMNYTLNEINTFVMGRPLPDKLMAFREKLRSKRRRITELLTLIFGYYGLDNDITQAIITTVSTAHRNSLMTISDIITLIDKDISEGTTYHVDNALDSSAVTIMTMHKSKGLEFPIVIVPYMDSKVIPNNKPDDEIFMYTDKIGLRCSRSVCREGDYAKICKSWKTTLAKAAEEHDYSEDRRLLFVTLSRAKQYETLICSDKPSIFMDELSGETYTSLPASEPVTLHTETTEPRRPDLSGYKPRNLRLGVHDIMEFDETGTKGMSEPMDEAPGKGKEYGTMIHNLAYSMLHYDDGSEAYPELDCIRGILKKLDGAKKLGEVNCTLPVRELDVVLRGQIDLLAEYDDRIEIHDYKTDVGTEFETEYKLQLSVYAHAAEQFYGKPVTCVIDYVSQGKSVTFDPLPMDLIRERTAKHIPTEN